MLAEPQPRDEVRDTPPSLRVEERGRIGKLRTVDAYKTRKGPRIGIGRGRRKSRQVRTTGSDVATRSMAVQMTRAASEPRQMFVQALVLSKSWMYCESRSGGRRSMRSSRRPEKNLARRKLKTREKIWPQARDRRRSGLAQFDRLTSTQGSSQ